MPLKEPEEKKPANCPFMPPYVQESKGLDGRITGANMIPVPCMGKSDPVKGGGCAAWFLCQEFPRALLSFGKA